MSISEEGMIVLNGREVGFGTKNNHDFAFIIKARLGHEPTESEKDALYQVGEILSEAFRKGNHETDPESKIEAERDRSSLLECFGHSAVFVEEIPNGYCNRSCCAHLPWFIVSTPVGRIKIGWRKRVIHLEWTDTIIKQSAEELFSDDVTRYDKVIHCYGYVKAREYIDRLMEIALEKNPELASNGVLVRVMPVP